MKSIVVFLIFFVLMLGAISLHSEPQNKPMPCPYYEIRAYQEIFCVPTKLK